MSRPRLVLHCVKRGCETGYVHNAKARCADAQGCQVVCVLLWRMTRLSVAAWQPGP